MATNPKPYPQIAKDRIRATKLITRLQKCALGKVEMKATEISAAKTLLDKVIPNLAQVQQDVNLTYASPESLTDDLLAHIAAGSGDGAVSEATSPKEPPPVH